MTIEKTMRVPAVIDYEDRMAFEEWLELNGIRDWRQIGDPYKIGREIAFVGDVVSIIAPGSFTVDRHNRVPSDRDIWLEIEGDE